MFTKQNGTPKPDGMTMMINRILISIGLSPEVITAYVENGRSLATQFVAAMSGVNQRMQRLEEQQQIIIASLSQIEAKIGIHPQHAKFLESTECPMPKQ
jgi:hypothetical protein